MLKLAKTRTCNLEKSTSQLTFQPGGIGLLNLSFLSANTVVLSIYGLSAASWANS